MGDRAIGAFVSLISAIIFLAVIAVILSKQADTKNVISSAGNALSGIIGAAVNPVSGNGGFSNVLNTSSGIITNLTGSLN